MKYTETDVLVDLEDIADEVKQKFCNSKYCLCKNEEVTWQNESTETDIAVADASRQCTIEVSVDIEKLEDEFKDWYCSKEDCIGVTADGECPWEAEEAYSELEGYVETLYEDIIVNKNKRNLKLEDVIEELERKRWYSER